MGFPPIPERAPKSVQNRTFCAKSLQKVLMWQVCRVNFARKIFVRDTNFLTKNAPKFSPKCLSLCICGSGKIPGKFPPNFSLNFPKRSPRKIKKKSPTSFCKAPEKKVPFLHTFRRSFWNCRQLHFLRRLIIWRFRLCGIVLKFKIASTQKSAKERFLPKIAILQPWRVLRKQRSYFGN